MLPYDNTYIFLNYQTTVLPTTYITLSQLGGHCLHNKVSLVLFTSALDTLPL